MTELRELRAVIPPPRPGRTKVSASATKEAAATYFAIDAEAGTITWHKRHFKPVSYRLPGHTQPAALPVLCKVLTVFLVLYEPSMGRRYDASLRGLLSRLMKVVRSCKTQYESSS